MRYYRGSRCEIVCMVGSLLVGLQMTKLTYNAALLEKSAVAKLLIEVRDLPMIRCTCFVYICIV